MLKNYQKPETYVQALELEAFIADSASGGPSPADDGEFPEFPKFPDGTSVKRFDLWDDFEDFEDDGDDGLFA